MAMRIGAYLPNFGPSSLGQGMLEVARVLEQAGADSLWISDHLCVPEHVESRYPYSPDGTFPFPREMPWMETLTSLAALSVATETARLGTAILVATQRNPIELAKATATIDQLSGGRLLMGLGSGWLREEIEALGYDPRTRGRRLDDVIAMLRDCWSGRTEGYTGDVLSTAPSLHCYPTPVHPVPILIGGLSEAAFSRAARLADGWLPDWPIGQFDPDKAATASATLDEQLAAEGRDPSSFLRIAMVECEPQDADRLPDVATVLASLGFDEMIAELPLDDLERSADLLASLRATATHGPGERSAETVAPLGHAAIDPERPSAA